MKLKAALLGFTFLAATTAAQDQLYFGADDLFATGHTQAPLNSDYQLACESLANTISPVFPPGGFPSPFRPHFLF
jgi:hypothetical protein